MKSKVLYILLIAMGLSGAVNAQLNNYKYIVVPKHFNAFNAANKYQTSTLVKHYFANNNFDVVYEDNLPADLAADRCLGLLADIIDDSSMFTTKVSIALKDCNNVEVFRSIEGTSKIKEYKESYKQAIQNAFASFTGMKHKYEPKQQNDITEETQTVTVSFKDDVKSVEEKSKEHVLEQKATKEEQVYKSVEPKPTDILKAVSEEKIVPALTGTLYAQPIENGYQLVDSTPKILLKLEETSMDKVFMTDFNGNNAVVFQKDGKWLLEYSENGQKVQKELNIKF